MKVMNLQQVIQELGFTVEWKQQFNLVEKDGVKRKVESEFRGAWNKDATVRVLAHKDVLEAAPTSDALFIKDTPMVAKTSGKSYLRRVICIGTPVVATWEYKPAKGKK